MSILVTAAFPVKPERLDEFLGIMKAALVDTRAFDGCEALDTYVSQDVAGEVVLVERWEDRTKHEAYMAWRGEGDMTDLLTDFLTAPPKIAYFDPHPDI
jgi:quinol monooxygenase YgiN